MDLGLKGRAAIVQGTSQGLGRGIAEAFAAEGCNVILTARNEDALTRTASEIAERHGVRAVPYAADSADLTAVHALPGEAGLLFGRLDILVCNSGGPPPGTFDTIEPQQWRDAADLLILSPVTLLKAALPLLRQSPAGRFFIVTSSSTRQPVHGLTLSNVFRPGIVGLIKTLAEELAADGICCHSLAPGRFDTARLANLMKVLAEKKGVTPEDIRAQMEASIPAGRLGQPEELGALAAFLASGRAGYLTGQNWLADGGLVNTI